MSNDQPQEPQAMRIKPPTTVRNGAEREVPTAVDDSVLSTAVQVHPVRSDCPPEDSTAGDVTENPALRVAEQEEVVTTVLAATRALRESMVPKTKSAQPVRTQQTRLDKLQKQLCQIDEMYDTALADGVTDKLESLDAARSRITDQINKLEDRLSLSEQASSPSRSHFQVCMWAG